MGEVPLCACTPLDGVASHPQPHLEGLLEIKDTHRPWDGSVLLGIAQP